MSAESTAGNGSVEVSMSPALREYILSFADDEHLMGQHHTEWIGVAPFLEEDLALSSIGQDELGHAVMLYELILDLDGIEATDTAVDELAFRRSAAEYRSSALTEYPASDWAETLVRHWIYDMVEDIRWSLVADSKLAKLGEISIRADREERYHRRHADALVETLLRTDGGRERILAALDAILRLLPSLVSTSDAEHEMVAAGIASATLAAQLPTITQNIVDRFGVTAGIVPAEAANGRAERSEHFAPMMARMLEVLDYDPQATW